MLRKLLGLAHKLQSDRSYSPSGYGLKISVKDKTDFEEIPSLVRTIIIIFVVLILTHKVVAQQIDDAEKSSMVHFQTQHISDMSFGAGFTHYNAVWPIMKEYPGASNFQTALGGYWLVPQQTETDPDYYHTIEGGLGWWHDTRFGTATPKFIMGGVAHNFFAWANGPGAGSSEYLSNGQRDWSTSGGKYGIAQLSNRILWAPDGLNMAQGLNGELLGYGYTPLPITDPMTQTAGVDIATGNQCWTLFMNTTNFKGPVSFFLPTFWTKPALEDPSLEGLFFDTRPSDPNVTLAIEQAIFPSIISTDSNGSYFLKTKRLQFPTSGYSNSSILMHQPNAYSKDALWNEMNAWFNGGTAVQTEFNQSGIINVDFVNNGGYMYGEVAQDELGLDGYIDLNYVETDQYSNIARFKFDLNTVENSDDFFVLPEYFRLDSDDKWRAIDAATVPNSTNLLTTEVPITSRSEIPYLTPKEPDYQLQDPDSPWNNPGPSAGPFTADLGDGSTVTYYWYKFIDQPAIVNANLPESMRSAMQTRVELIHSNWSHTDEYLAPPSIGQLATIDPKAVIEPPAGFEIGYVPIVTRQEKTPTKVRVFVLAGQSNMQGQGVIDDPENDPGDLINVIENDINGDWSEIGTVNNWTILENVYLYYESGEGTIKDNVTVGQGAYPNAIGPELMFAHQIDEFYDDPVLIIKTAWGGKSLAEDFRPPSAGGTTGEYYNKMIQIVQNVTQNLSSEFPSIGSYEFELSGFAWFQGWNDGDNDGFLNEYESNLTHLVDDVRNDLGVAELPFVVVSSGHGGYTPSTDLWVQSIQNIISVAQESVGCDDASYGGHVGFVDTKPFYIEDTVAPYDGVFHFNNHALTFLNIGKSMGNEMIRAINGMAFCYDCDNQVAPNVVSIGNRVWNDIDRNGINDPDEPGIAGVSIQLWGDSDDDGIPDEQVFGGFQRTDANGYYNFGGLRPGNYQIFVMGGSDNWGTGQPLENFQSTNGFVTDVNNDIDFDNNGSGAPFTNIASGIITLTVDGEPLNDGDPFDCFFDYDKAGNNSVDFGFYYADMQIIEEPSEEEIQVFPNPALDELTIKNNTNLYQIKIYDVLGRLYRIINPTQETETINVSALSNGVYFLNLVDNMSNSVIRKKIIKQ